MRQKYFLVQLQDSGAVVDMVLNNRHEAKLFDSVDEALEYLKDETNQLSRELCNFKIAAINEQTLTLETVVVITNDSPFTTNTPFYEE